MFGIAFAMMMVSWGPRVGAQWTATFNVDEQQAISALGSDRVPHMRQALDRVKAKLERILTGSTGSLVVTIDWSPPISSPTALAESLTSQEHAQSVAVARDKLINQATADNEPQSEINLYEALPNSSVPFRYASATVLNAGMVRIPNSLNKHLAFQPTTNQNDGTIRLRPPSSQTKWQFWPPRTTGNLANHAVFEAVAIHEAVHLLGFISAANDTTPPASLHTWDLYRFGDANVPVAANDFGTLPRELRPTHEASAITALSSSASSFKLSRGERTGGDGFQASHWRALTRLNPPSAIGIMDPVSSAQVYASIGRRLYTRADVEALDVIGWNVNPDAVPYANSGSINLLSPVAQAQVVAGQNITFQWDSTGFVALTLQIYAGIEIVDDHPIRVFYQMPAGTTGVTLPGAESLPPGEYVWAVVGSTHVGYRQSEERRLTILPDCPPRVEAPGVIGWNVNPNAVPYANSGSINLLAPIAQAQIVSGQDITFQWDPTSFVALTLQIHSGIQVEDDSPVRVFYEMPGGTTSVTLQGTDPLAPGEYTWFLVGHTLAGYRSSEERRLTILPDCPADLDNGTGTGTPDGGVDTSDLLYFLALFEAGNLGADLDNGSGTGTPDGGVGIDDLLYFLVRFDAGC